MSHPDLDCFAEHDDNQFTRGLPEPFAALGYLWVNAKKQPDFPYLIILSVISALASGPFVLSGYLGYAISQLEFTLDSNGFTAITGFVIGLIGLGLLASFQTGKMAARVNSQLLLDVQLQGWEGIFHIGDQQIAAKQSSDLLSHLTDTVETLQKHQLYVLQNFVTAIVVVSLTVIVLCVYHISFFLLVTVFIILTCSVPIFIAKKSGQYLVREPSKFATLNRFLSSVLGQQMTFRFSKRNGLKNQFVMHLFHMASNQFGKWLYWNLSFNAKVSINLLSQAAIIGLGGWLYFAQTISLADLVVVYILTSMIMPRLDELYKIYNYAQSLGVCYSTLTSLPTRNSSVKQIAVPDGFSPITDISFKQIYFSYSETPNIVFKNLSLRFNTGMQYLILGASGSGKTTLIDLLLGILSPVRGQVLINGKPLLPDDLPAYWQRISIHDQSNLLLEQCSVLENITLFEKHYSQNRLDLACDLLQFTDCLHKPITALSGGEKQRLCFIRCFIRRADLYLFDEANSALDEQLKINQLILLKTLSDAVVIFVSHDSAIKDAFDHVIDLSGLAQNGLLQKAALCQ